MTYTKNTHCCSLYQICCDNEDSIEDLKRVIKSVKHTKRWRDGTGIRALFCITKTNEPQLIENLKILKFKPITEFDRRHCYDNENLGKLTMWMLKW